MNEEIFIKKASGERELFSEDKLRVSLEKAGTSKDVVDDIVAHIKAELHEDLTTAEIYRHAFKVLKRTKKEPIAARYSLKKAVMQLGPDGFPFEKFVGEILKRKGYKIKIGGMLQGACATHEVDVLAEKDDTHIFVECKFHNRHGIKTDLKVALYVRARFEDIKKAHIAKAKKEGRSPHVHEGWLVTNTKLTSLAIDYSNCIGQTVIGWNYPKGGSLRDLILETGVHPTTCLSTLTQAQKRFMLDSGAVACNDLKKDTSLLRKAGVSANKEGAVLEEMNNLCVPWNK